MGAIVIGVGIAVAISGVIFAAMGIGGIETTSGSAMLIAGSIGFIGGLLLVALGFVHRALVDVANRLDGIIHFEEEELEQLQSLAPAHRAEHGAGAEEFAQDFPGLAMPEPAPRAKPPRPAAPVPSAPGAAAPAAPAPAPRPPASPKAAPAMAAPPIVAPPVTASTPPTPPRSAPVPGLDEAAAPPVVRPPVKPTARPALEAAPEPEPVLDLDLGPLTDFSAADEPAMSPEPEPEAAKGGLPSWFRRKREAETREPPREPAMEADAAAPDDEAAPQFEPLPPPRPASDAARADLARREAEAAKRESEAAARRELPPFLRTGAPAAPTERPVAPDRPAMDRPVTDRPVTDRPMFGGFGLDKAEPRAPEPRTPEPRVTEPRAPEPRRAPEPAARELPPREPSVREDFAPDPGPPPAFLSEADLLGDDEPAAEPQVSVLKSGVIGGMAYKLYSDGSIEADLPDGTLRFASLQELRDHVSGVAPRSDV